MKTEYDPSLLIQQEVPILIKQLIYGQLLPVKHFANHDQSPIYGFKDNGRKFIPFQLAKWKGNSKISGDRATWTHIPTLIHHKDNNSCELGLSVFILKSGEGSPDCYHGPSPTLQRKLQRVGLNIGWNPKYQVYIDTSHNGWEQNYNIKGHLAILAQELPEFTQLQLDNWGPFEDPKLFKPILLNNKCFFTS